MQRPFEVTFTTRRVEFWRDVCSQLKQSKEVNEVYESFDVLQVWQKIFSEKYGDLQTLIHLSNPDDPPDVIARFSLGNLDIEHTEVEPPHVKQAEFLHKREMPGAGRNLLPLSGKFSPAQQKEIMWTPGHPQAWQTQDANLSARRELIVSAIKTKMSKYPRGGLLLLKADMGSCSTGISGEIHVIRHVCDWFKKLSDCLKWSMAIHNRWTPNEFFSVLYTHETGMIMKRKSIHGDDELSF